jgi:hypothetical protein
MDHEHSLSRSVVSGSFLGIFWGLWLQRISQAAFESKALRPWADNLNIDVTKWVILMVLVATVLLVISLLWVFTDQASQRQTILRLGDPTPDVTHRLDQNWKLTVATFLAISSLVIALPTVTFAFFGTPNAWEVAMAAAVLPLLLLLLVLWPGIRPGSSQ